MKEYFFEINGKKIVFFTEIKQDDVIVNLFLQSLKSLEKSIICDNKSFQIGWNYFVFKSKEEFYQIYTVDYTKNPFKDLTDDLSLALSIMRDQLLLTKKTGLISNEVITFQDTLIVRKSSLSSNNLYFEKQYPKKGNDSGWYMGNLDDYSESNDASDYKVLFLYQLLSICPKAISVMNLPVGTICIIKDNGIVGICDSENREVYANKE